MHAPDINTKGQELRVVASRWPSSTYLRTHNHVGLRAQVACLARRVPPALIEPQVQGFLTRHKPASDRGATTQIGNEVRIDRNALRDSLQVTKNMRRLCAGGFQRENKGRQYRLSAAQAIMGLSRRNCNRPAAPRACTSETIMKFSCILDDADRNPQQPRYDGNGVKSPSRTPPAANTYSGSHQGFRHKPSVGSTSCRDELCKYRRS